MTLFPTSYGDQPFLKLSPFVMKSLMPFSEVLLVVGKLAAPAFGITVATPLFTALCAACAVRPAAALAIAPKFPFNKSISLPYGFTTVKLSPRFCLNENHFSKDVNVTPFRLPPPCDSETYNCPSCPIITLAIWLYRVCP